MTKRNPRFVIKKGVPMPNIVRRRTSKYPFAYMEVGDCFDAVGVKTVAVAAACLSRKKRTGENFRIRTVNGVPTVWRIK